jgi:hypothetical protein
MIWLLLSFPCVQAECLTPPMYPTEQACVTAATKKQAELELTGRPFTLICRSKLNAN